MFLYRTSVETVRELFLQEFNASSSHFKRLLRMYSQIWFHYVSLRIMCSQQLCCHDLPEDVDHFYCYKPSTYRFVVIVLNPCNTSDNDNSVETASCGYLQFEFRKLLYLIVCRRLFEL